MLKQVGRMSSDGEGVSSNSLRSKDKKRTHFREDHEISRRIWEIRQKTEKWKSGVVEQIDGQINGLLEDVLQDIERPAQNGINTVRIDKENGSKIFKSRESVLTELLEVTHIRTIYNIFLSLLVVFFLNTIVYDYIDNGRLTIDVSGILWAFGKPSLVVNIWLVMMAMTLFIFPLFSAWVANRHSWLRIPSVLWGLAYVIYMTIFFIFPVQEIYLHDIPPVSSIIIIAEQIRLIMKVHAFVRVNAEKVLKQPPDAKDKESDKESSGEENERSTEGYTANISKRLPGFGQYLYFLFVPTLIYKDHYPMTPEVRWDYVFSNFIQVVMCVFYTYYVFARYCVPIFRNTGKEPGNFKTLLLSTFSCMLPGTMVLVLGFFAILHSWLNAWAEMTRFADRMFYKDWWNCTSYAAYYREWNVVVHDWLYAYIYCDMRKLLLTANEHKTVDSRLLLRVEDTGFNKVIRNRDLAAILVFVISAVVHEYVLVVSLRFFFPVLFIMFAGFGVLLAFLSPPKGKKEVSHIWNTGMWLTLFLGNGLIMCLYSQEFYATSNCPRTSVSCGCFSLVKVIF